MHAKQGKRGGEKMAVELVRVQTMLKYFIALDG